MKLLVFFGGALFALTHVMRGQDGMAPLAPHSLGNALYSSSTSISSSSSSATMLLKADGTYEALWSSSRISSMPVQYSVANGAGRYTYTVTGPDSADLAFISEAGTKIDKLKFLTPTQGSIETQFSFGTSFTLFVSNPKESMVATSLRVRISVGSTAIAGIAIAGTEPRLAVVRAVGPGLVRFGLSDVLPDPVLGIYDSGGRRVLSAASWSASPTIPQESLRRLMMFVGMYPLADDSNDVVVLGTLAPGANTIQCSSASGTSGEVVIECYLL